MPHMDKELFKFTENCLRRYHQNLAELRLRREYIEGLATKSPSELSPDRIDGGADTCALQRHAERIDGDADIARLERMTQPIRDFLAILADEDRQFIELRYFQERSWYQISDALHVSVETASRRWRGRLVRKAAQMIFGNLV